MINFPKKWEDLTRQIKNYSSEQIKSLFNSED